MMFFFRGGGSHYICLLVLSLSGYFDCNRGKICPINNPYFFQMERRLEGAERVKNLRYHLDKGGSCATSNSSNTITHPRKFFFFWSRAKANPSRNYKKKMGLNARNTYLSGHIKSSNSASSQQQESPATTGDLSRMRVEELVCFFTSKGITFKSSLTRSFLLIQYYPKKKTVSYPRNHSPKSQRYRRKNVRSRVLLRCPNPKDC